MPRQPRLDAPDTLHHVMVRGIERTPRVREDGDRADFLARLASLAEAGALTVYAWALLPNHAHLLVRTGTRPLPRSMRSLLTGYAGTFNRRHTRVGHLFQNRYKSILVEVKPGELLGREGNLVQQDEQTLIELDSPSATDRQRNVINGRNIGEVDIFLESLSGAAYLGAFLLTAGEPVNNLHT
jgi:REP element-mobilizing transposase RayT